MGEPKFARPKFDTPSHPWKAERIEEEHQIQKNHGLKNMREIWNAETFDLIKFKSQFHEDFMFIRETSLVDRDEFCAEIDQLMAEGKDNIPLDDMELIHENEDVTELRWVDGNERIVRINLKKDGLIWRSIVKRTPINN